MTGRPSDFTPEVANEICERLAKGQSLRFICEDQEGGWLPSETTVRRWLAKGDAEPDGDFGEFRRQYAQAREAQADHYAEEIIDIADGKDKPDRAQIDAALDGTIVIRDHNRDRLRIDARKWYASKLAPKKYGEKLAVGGDDELGPVKHEFSWLPSEQ